MDNLVGTVQGDIHPQLVYTEHFGMYEEYLSFSWLIEGAGILQALQNTHWKPQKPQHQ